MTKRLLIITLSLFAFSVNAQITSYPEKLINPTNWIVNPPGTSPDTPGFTAIGDVNENKIVLDNTPKGIDNVWKGSYDASVANTTHGGFLTGLVSIPNNQSKTYRCSIWVKRNYNASAPSNLRTFFGLGAHTSLTTSVGVSTLAGGVVTGVAGSQTSPYFYSYFPEEVGVWYLIVAYVHGYNVDTQNTTLIGGMYNGTTGERTTAPVTDFKLDTQTILYLKTKVLLKNTGNAGDFQSYYEPRIEVVDGTEPSIDQLLGKGAQSSITNTLYPTKLGINTSKNIGAYSLAVNGDMIAKSVKVDLTGPWPDYVFENDYKLKSLEEIECFVNENKHLPEVPSSKEVNKEGINLGEMNAKLLRKIEEITLYLINQNKQIKDLQSELEKIKEIK